MFGRQDDSDTAANSSSFLNDPTPTSWAAPTTNTTPPPTAPPVNDQAAPSASLLEPSASDGYVAPTPAPSAPDASNTTPVSSVVSDDLMDLKQHALQQLSPLVGQLDQSPEEKFRTTMMMIQASDNQALLKDAFGAAQQIGDDKQRAQALLDLINEINYFTQQPAA